MKSNIQQIKKLVESTPNDAVLGEKVRNLFSKDEEFVEDNNIFVVYCFSF